MPCLYLVYAALVPRTAEEIFSPKIRKLWKHYLFNDYILKRDQKSENFECFRKNVSSPLSSIPIRFTKVNVTIAQHDSFKII